MTSMSSKSTLYLHYCLAKYIPTYTGQSRGKFIDLNYPVGGDGMNNSYEIVVMWMQLYLVKYNVALCMVKVGESKVCLGIHGKCLINTYTEKKVVLQDCFCP